jgi:hypothetical protein
MEAGGFLELSPSRELGAPPGGSRAAMRWSHYRSQESGAASFTRLDAFAERIQMFLNQQRAIVVRARTALSVTETGDAIPFYLQPQLGGPFDLRGFAGRRFYDNNLMTASPEYQWQIFSGMWLPVFADAGKVFPRWDKWGLNGLESSYGMGVRFSSSEIGAGRFDVAFSREGGAVLGSLRNLLIRGALVLLCSSALPENGPRIRPDDPIWREPPPVNVGKLVKRKIDDTYDQLEKMFFLPRGSAENGPPRAHGTNTLGEAPDSASYTNRHGRRRMPMEELLRGPGNHRSPDPAGPWTILRAKSEGVTPGFVIRDRAGRTYFLKSTRRGRRTRRRPLM